MDDLSGRVVKGQLDPVFSFKDEHKSEQDFKIKYNMYRYWNAVSVGYAKYLTIILFLEPEWGLSQ